jgi:hypothetical protein
MRLKHCKLADTRVSATPLKLSTLRLRKIGQIVAWNAAHLLLLPTHSCKPGRSDQETCLVKMLCLPDLAPNQVLVYQWFSSLDAWPLNA